MTVIKRRAQAYVELRAEDPTKGWQDSLLASRTPVIKLKEAQSQISGAEIEQAVISGLFDAFYTRAELATAHILEALRQTVPLSKTIDEHISRLRAWAEGRARNASVPRAAKSEDPT